MSWNAESYHVNSAAQKKWAEDILKTVRFKGDERILDIGCGDGKITAYIARTLPKSTVLGIDASQDMVSFASGKYTQDEYPNLSFQCADARRLGFTENFDVVVSFSCLHWIKEHDLVLKGIKDCLKTSGKAYLQFGGTGNAAQALLACDNVISRFHWKKYFQSFEFPWHFYDQGYYAKLLKEAGLKQLRLELVPKKAEYDGEGMKSWMETTWFPYMRALPEKMRGDFLEDVVAEYSRLSPPDKNGKLTLGMVRLEVEAEKEK